MNEIKQYTENDLNFVEVTHSDFKVVLCDFAASLYEIWLDNKLMTTQVVDTNVFKNFWVFFGKTVGRIAGRQPHGKITIDGNTYSLSINEMGNTLHGGWDGLSAQRFHLKEIKNEATNTLITYEYLSPDGQSGFMGNLLTQIIYDISAIKEEIKISFKAICDKKSPINITNHVFFSLGDSNIDNLKLLVKSHKFVYPRGLDLMPVEVRDITPCLDFNNYKLIIQDINHPDVNYGRARGYDHFFILDNQDGTIPQLMLENDKYHLDVYTDYSGIKVYTDNFMDDKQCKNTDGFYHRGVAIEAQCSALHNIIFDANTEVNHWVKFCLTRK